MADVAFVGWGSFVFWGSEPEGEMNRMDCDFLGLFFCCIKAKP